MGRLSTVLFENSYFMLSLPWRNIIKKSYELNLWIVHPTVVQHTIYFCLKNHDPLQFFLERKSLRNHPDVPKETQLLD